MVQFAPSVTPGPQILFEQINYSQRSTKLCYLGCASIVAIEAIPSVTVGGILPAMTLTVLDAPFEYGPYSNVIDLQGVSRALTAATKFLVYGCRPFIKVETSGFSNATWQINACPIYTGQAAQGQPLADLADAWPIRITDGDATTQPLTSADFNLVFTSPAAAGTETVGNIQTLTPYRSIILAAELAGATGGPLDVYLQVRANTAAFYDWVHFPQIAAGASVAYYLIAASRGAQSSGITLVGRGTTPVIADNTFVGGDFGDRINVVCTAGVGTSAGGLCQINVRAQP